MVTSWTDGTRNGDTSFGTGIRKIQWNIVTKVSAAEWLRSCDELLVEKFLRSAVTESG